MDLLYYWGQYYKCVNFWNVSVYFLPFNMFIDRSMLLCVNIFQPTINLVNYYVKNSCILQTK